MLVLRRLAIFRAVMTQGSISGAARAVGIAQPAVSRIVRELEEEFGFLLFERRHQRLVPTPEALELLDEVERLLAHEIRIEDRIRTLRSAESGVLRIAGIPTLAESILSWAAADFLGERPEVRVRLDAYSSGRIIELVERQEIDLGLVHGPVETNRLLVEELCETELVCLLPKSHPLARRRVLRLADLEAEHLVTAGPESAPGRLFRDAATSSGLRPCLAAESNASAIRLRLALRRNLVTVIDPWLPVTQPLSGLTIRRLEPRMPMRALVLSSPDRPLSRLATEFRGNLHRTLAEITRLTPVIRAVAAAGPGDADIAGEGMHDGALRGR
ncbi:LysR family transcriptional regulator [Propylenella binzhouense]|nr:LysR family transcriptional regulator [Propylenella binzhouense]